MSEDSSRYLTEEQALGMQRACEALPHLIVLDYIGAGNRADIVLMNTSTQDKCMMAYCLLAEKAASPHRPLWPLKPKFHVTRMQSSSLGMSTNIPESATHDHNNT